MSTPTLLGAPLRRAALALLLAVPLTAVAAPAASDGERWALSDASPLPGRAPHPLPWPVGTVLTVSAHALAGPVPLACAPARQRLMRTPAQGLFQGALEPLGADGAAAFASALRLPGDGAAATLRVDCPNASFDLHVAPSGELHVAPSGELLLALDGQVLHWRPAQGATAPPPGPQAVVRRLLLRHLGGGASFGADAIAAITPWLSRGLQRRFDRWLSAPQNPDEVPALDGDPFTDSQEPPLDLAVGAPQPASRDTARVPVRLHFESRPVRTLHMQLKREADGHWRVDDIDYGRGLRLSMLLADAPPAAR